ncbi:MAG TPA: hypothetical protein P5533_00455 [Candidatus Cloacimonadota bacterium]|nr:hypothetical protein [Candidatus Cloacimonadota bacterium]
MKKSMLILVIIGIMLLAGSLSAKSSQLLQVFEISPNPMGSYTVVSLEFQQDVNVCVYIEEQGGAIVKTLFNGVVGKGINLTWDRITDSGYYATNGLYSVVVAYEGRYTSTKKTLILK